MDLIMIFFVVVRMNDRVRTLMLDTNNKSDPEHADLHIQTLIREVGWSMRSVWNEGNTPDEWSIDECGRHRNQGLHGRNCQVERGCNTLVFLHLHNLHLIPAATVRLPGVHAAL